MARMAERCVPAGMDSVAVEAADNSLSRALVVSTNRLTF